MAKLASWKHERALVVDDSLTTRATLVGLLKPTLIQIDEAHDVSSCLQQIHNTSYDLILLDLALPDGNGLEILEKVRERNQESTIVMITGTSDIATATKALLTGSDGYIEKHHLLDGPNKFLDTLSDAREHRLKKIAEAKRQVSLQDLAAQSMRDPLTGSFNRRYLEQRLDSEVKLAHRHSKPLSVIMLDMDKFKSVNDNHGHSIGDLVLVQLAQTTKKVMRETDALVRYGGEEFVVLLPETDVSGAERLGEKVRTAVETFTFGDNCHVLKLTCSLGVAALAREENGPQLVDRADRALYEAKSSGRNKVVVAS